jgi:hypothetical protein
MKICSPVFCSALILASFAVPGLAQQGKPSSAKVKESAESQFARQNLKDVLDAVDSAWFGKTYQGVTSVDLTGTLQINLSAAAMNAKAESMGQGAVKGKLTKGANVNVKLKTTYFANADFRTEFTGEFGDMLYYRSGNRGFLYSKEQNAYTTKVEPPPSDAPVSFLGWFRQCINDIQAVYVDGGSFRAALGREAGGGNQQTLIFNSPTAKYDPKKREQSMAESLGFWKKGRLEVVFDKATKLPQSMNFSNEGQGIATQMTFAYLPGGKVHSVTISNQSKGMEGPASMQISYGGDGLMNHIAGEMGFSQGRLNFDMDMAWSNSKKPSAIVTIPPPGATKKGREEMETMLLVNLAGKVLDLQHSGFNLRSVTLTN